MTCIHEAKQEQYISLNVVIVSFRYLIFSFQEIFKILCCCDAFKGVCFIFFSIHLFALFIWSRNYEDKKLLCI